MSDSSQPPSAPASTTPLPIHLVSHDGAGNEIAVHRKRGRPRVVRPAPSADEAAYVERINRARDAHVERDAVVNATTTEEILESVLLALAEEQASIAFLIRHGPQEPRAIEIARSRRIDGLHKISLTILGMRRAGVEPDLSPKKFAILKKDWFDIVTSVANETLPGALAERVLKLYEERLEDATSEPIR